MKLKTKTSKQAASLQHTFEKMVLGGKGKDGSKNVTDPTSIDSKTKTKEPDGQSDVIQLDTATMQRYNRH
jgi:hypothetical protein